MQTNNRRCTELHAFERTAVAEIAVFVAETVPLYRVSDISAYSGEGDAENSHLTRSFI